VNGYKEIIVVPELMALIELQQIDIAIKEIEATNINLNKQLEKEKEEIAKKEAILREIKEKHDVLQKDLRHNERKLQQAEQNIEGFEKKIYQVKSQKELEAVDHEIAKSRQERSTTEDTLLTLMVEIDDITQKIKEEEKEFKKKSEDFNRQSQKIESDININTQELLETNIKRQKIVGAIEPSFLNNYEKLRLSRNNLAMVHINGGICQGCFVTLPPQQINEVKMGKEIVKCNSCARILYWKE